MELSYLILTHLSIRIWENHPIFGKKYIFIDKKVAKTKVTAEEISPDFQSKKAGTATNVITFVAVPVYIYASLRKSVMDWAMGQFGAWGQSG